jgi:hypothetical protein
MTSIPHESARPVDTSSRPLAQFELSHLWASIAICVIWLAVLFDAIFGPNIVNNTAGGDWSSVPSAVVVALFASLATWAVAKYGFGRRRGDA